MEIIEKPWGYEKILTHNSHYAGKIIFVRAGERLSEQYHKEKQETMFVVDGEAVIRFYPRNKCLEYKLYKGDVIDIMPTERHRLSAVTDTTILEISTPELDDVVRLNDDYGRVLTNQ